MIVQDLLMKQAYASEAEQAAAEEQERKDAKRKAILATLAGVAGVGAAGFGGKWLYDKYKSSQNPAELLDSPTQLLDVVNGRLGGKLPAGVNKETAKKALLSLAPRTSPYQGIGGDAALKVGDSSLSSIATPEQLGIPSFFQNAERAPAVTPGFSDALSEFGDKITRDAIEAGPKFEQAPGFVRSTAANLVNNAKRIKGGVEEGFNNGVEGINDAAGDVGEYYRGVGNKIGETAVGAKDAIVGAGEDVKAGAQTAWRKFW